MYKYLKYHKLLINKKFKYFLYIILYNYILKCYLYYKYHESLIIQKSYIYIYIYI